MLEGAGGLGVEFAVLADQPRGHARIVCMPRSGLKRSRWMVRAFSTRARMPSKSQRALERKASCSHCGRIHVQLDAVQERSADALAVLLDDGRIATALMLQVAAVAAPAGI